MAVSGHGIVIEIIGDERAYLRAVESTLSANTKLDSSFRQVGVNATLSADAQIKAAVKAQEALRANALALTTRARLLPGGSREQVAATLLASEAQAKYARSLGVTIAGTRQLSGAAQTAERDLNKAVRGALAGSGVFSKLGRSLAFASSGFIAVAVGSQLISRSISQAEDLAKAQRSLDEAIQHTGGSVAHLGPRYQATARDAARFGQSEVDALTSLARATVLTGDAASAQRAYQEALVISKATGKDFNAVLIAAAKGQEGVTTSLRRYGILVASTSTGQEQYTQVMKRFGGQAAANTTESDRLRASVANFEATLGTALLPTFDRLAGRLTDWLSKMEKSGRLQKDVNNVVTEAGHVFHTLGGILNVVDTVTGSFAHTMELLIGLKFASMVSGWVGNLGRLTGAWRGVTVAAGEAAAAETAAAGGAGVAGASGVAARVGMYTGAGAAAAAARGAGGASLLGRIGKLGGLVAGGFVLGDAGAETGQDLGTRLIQGNPYRGFRLGGRDYWMRVNNVGGFVPFGANGRPTLPAAIQQAWNKILNPRGSTTSSSTGPFGGAKPISQWAAYQLSNAEQMAQSQAALTKSTTDDVATARAVVARIKRTIDHGHLQGAALIQALQAEAAAMSTIWSAEDAAAQKRAADAQAAQARIQAQIQDSIDPLRLEVALSRAQALGKPLAAILRRLRAAAEAALKSGKLSLDQQKQAWDQITSLNQQLASQSTAQTAQWRQASTRALTAGLHLTDAQRRALRARLSQLGPGRTLPGTGTGAYGYEIGASGRPIEHHHHIYIDGKEVEHSVTRHQQKRRRRSSSQRRGPHAGD